MISNSSSIVRILPTRWGLSTALVVLAVAGALKWNAGLMPTPVAILNPAPPVPNARELYDQAELLRGKDSNTLETKIYLTFDAKRGHYVPTIASLPMMRQLVAEDQPAFARLREGFRYQYQSPPVRSFDTLLPYYAEDRDMARLLRIKGETDAYEGNWNEAINDDLDVVQLGTSLQHRAVLIGGLVGIACDYIGRKDAWAVLDHLTGPQARAAAMRLSAITSEQVPWSSVLQEEKWSHQAGLLEIYQRKNWRREMYMDTYPSNPEDDSNSAGSQPTMLARLNMSLVSPRVIFNSYTRCMNEAVQRVGLSWPARRALPALAAPSDPFNDQLGVLFDDDGFKQTSNDAYNNLLLTELALRAYREGRGAYPASLNALVPAYLPRVPLDPFTDGQPLRYRLANGRPLLYSVGPDATDDGGKPRPLQKRGDGTIIRYLQESDTGDLLPGDE